MSTNGRGMTLVESAPGYEGTARAPPPKTNDQSEASGRSGWAALTKPICSARLARAEAATTSNAKAATVTRAIATSVQPVFTFAEASSEPRVDPCACQTLLPPGERKR